MEASGGVMARPIIGLSVVYPKADRWVWNGCVPASSDANDAVTKTRKCEEKTTERGDREREKGRKIITGS